MPSDFNSVIKGRPSTTSKNSFINKMELSPVIPLNVSSPFMTQDLNESPDHQAKQTEKPFKSKFKQPDSETEDQKLQQKLEMLFKQNLEIQQQLVEMKSKKNKENLTMGHKEKVRDSIRNIELT